MGGTSMSEMEIQRPSIERKAMVQALAFLGLDANKIVRFDAGYDGLWVQYQNPTATDYDELEMTVFYQFV